jgi:hypothetical protein
MRDVVLVLLAALIAAPALAQQSPSYRLKESTVNAGGDPRNGVPLASASFRVTLDAIGDSIVRPGLASSSFHVNGGFVSAYSPPGEVAGLVFADDITLVWHPERSIGVYNLYRDLLSSLAGGGQGNCQQFDLTSEAAIEAGTPPTGNGWFYLVTAENLLHEEGTKGWNSAGSERSNPHPCP